MPAYLRLPKLWRIRGRSSDGLVVTLGRYETRPEAQLDFERFNREGRYRDIELQEILSPDPLHPSSPPT
jgi:hypothetical protein